MIKTTKIKFVISSLFISIPFLIFAQQLSCEDFKQGRFYIPSKDVQGKKIKVWVNRSLSSQKEYSKANDTIYGQISWISDCAFRLKYNTDKMSLSKSQQWMQDNDGLVITMTEVNGKCMSYKAVLTLDEGGEIGQNGKICIE